MIEAKRELMDKTYEVQSIRDRIRDLEWEAEFGASEEEALLEERRRAIDKLRFTRDEMHAIAIQILTEDLQ